MNAKQQHVFDTVKNGANILITGSAGTGKSYVIDKIVKWAKDNEKKVGVTASTGLAACLLRGRTIHSFLGVGLAKKSAELLAQATLTKNKPLAKRLQALDILIIDESSMIDAEFFDKISQYLCIVRNNPLPFGGIQLVLSGDFCQLPPIMRGYCFEAKTFHEANIQVQLLTELVRQDGDDTFKRILEELRWGLCSKDTMAILKKLFKTQFDNGIIPTRLYSLNVDVDNINKKEMDKLIADGAKSHVYETMYSNNTTAHSWAQSLKISEKVSLCVGAQVYFTCNMQGDNALVNGTRAIVKEVTPTGVYVTLLNGETVFVEPHKTVNEENDKMNVTFIPLKLAFALSIHKSQGMTLDAVEIDLGDSIFEFGQAYTALSRAKSLSSIRLISVKASSFKTHPSVKRFYGM